jgi:hypothetical protein
MRKILLTTTALVALGGVSAASALDISGSYEFTYTNADDGTADTGGANNTSFGNDALVKFSGSQTSDAGLTFGGSYSINGSAAVEDMGLTITGDFGTVMAGQTDGRVDANDNFMNFATYVETGHGTGNSTMLNGGAAMSDNATQGKVGYSSPNISGFQLHLSMEDAGTASKADNFATLLTYETGGLKVGFGTMESPEALATGADTSQTNWGFGYTYGDINVRYSIGTDITSGAGGGADTSKVSTIDYGAHYSGIEGVGLYISIVKSEEKLAASSNTDDQLDSTAVGLEYAVAPGVSLLLEQTASDYADATSGGTNNDTLDTTFVGLSVSF